MKQKNKGFTLLELLIVMGIIAILGAAVIATLDVGRQFAQARDSARETHVNALFNAIVAYQASNMGSLDGLGITDDAHEGWVEICNTGSKTSDEVGDECEEYIDLSPIVYDFISEIPVDPSRTDD